jgi:glycosyltransferase involved in cell wall biosynthesis
MDKPIKVLHIIKSLGRGGAETLLPETLKLHDKRKFEFHYIYFLPWKNQMVESIEQAGGHVMCIAARNNIFMVLSASKVISYIKHNDIDIVHSHLPWAGVVARLAKKLRNVPLVYTEHNKQERYHGITRIMNLSTIGANTRILAVSDEVAVSIRKFKPKLRAPLSVLANGVNSASFSRSLFSGNEVRVELNIPADAIVTGTVSVFREQKRLDVWLQTAAAILKDHPNTHFIIVGDGPKRDEIFKLRNDLGLVERVHLVGLQTEVRPYLAAMDIFMMASKFEGLPVALLEAMAMSLPVVSSSAGGIPQVVRNGVEGLLCDVEATRELPALVGKLVGDRDLRRSCGDAARMRILANFDMSRMVKELENIYHNLAPK